MKKNYIAPESKTVLMNVVSMVCQSGVSSDKDIDYGGVDDDGDKEPAARRRRDVWDDGEDEGL